MAIPGAAPPNRLEVQKTLKCTEWEDEARPGAVAPENIFATFSVGDEAFGIPIREVAEILQHQTITRLPELPPYLMGVMNHRGRSVPVLDMRLLLQRRWTEDQAPACILVVEINGLTVGVVVDRFLAMMELSERQLSAFPEEEDEPVFRSVPAFGREGEEVKLLGWEKLLEKEWPVLAAVYELTRA
jgi:purine-binding chemotaxis protein CheW